MNSEQLTNIIEAALLVAGRPLTLDDLQHLFIDDLEKPDKNQLKSILESLTEKMSGSGVALFELSSGYQLQAKAELSPWLCRLWEERPPRYTRALLETLALIAYQQPITRSEIEEVRGVSISSSILKTLLEREWIRIVGHKEIPGKPALYATTKNFLDYFNLKSLEELPPLADIKDIEKQAEHLLTEGVEQLLTANIPQQTESSEKPNATIDYRELTDA